MTSNFVISADQAFSSKRLAAEYATCLFDLGMGTGKIVVQAFLQFRNLQYVFGVELSSGRYKVAEECALKMVKLLGEDNFSVVCVPGKKLVIAEVLRGQPNTSNPESTSTDPSPDLSSEKNIEGILEIRKERILHLECGDMFDITNIELADIVMLETDIPPEIQSQLCQLLGNMHEGARTLTYLDLRKLWGADMSFRQLDCNRYLSDRFPTSWSVQRGHHFFIWVKVRLGHR